MGTLAAGEGGARRHKVPQPPTPNTPKAGPALTPFLSKNLPSFPLETKLASAFPRHCYSSDVSVPHACVRDEKTLVPSLQAPPGQGRVPLVSPWAAPVMFSAG